jgi:DNA-binding response OmpR family regulator
MAKKSRKKSGGRASLGRVDVSARVMIAEDEANLVESLSFILGEAGFDVSAVFDGDAVLDRLRVERPDVLVLDVMMPKRSGFEVLKVIKADPGLRGIPVMVLTAKGQERDRKTAEDLGADTFVTKPFSNQEIVEHIKRLVGTRAV